MSEGKTKAPALVRAAPASPVDPVTVTVPEAIRLSGLSRSGLYRLAASGDLALVKSGSRSLVRMDSLRAYLTKLPGASLRTPR